MSLVLVTPDNVKLSRPNFSPVKPDHGNTARTKVLFIVDDGNVPHVTDCCINEPNPVADGESKGYQFAVAVPAS